VFLYFDGRFNSINAVCYDIVYVYACVYIYIYIYIYIYRDFSGKINIKCKILHILDLIQ
jgi:hypothetical protein